MQFALDAQTDHQRNKTTHRFLAIGGSAILLVRALSQPWQYAVLAAAALLLLGLRRGVVLTLLGAAAAGVLTALASGPLPH